MTVKIFAGQETVSVNLTEPMKISQALDLAGQHMDLPCAGNGPCPAPETAAAANAR